MLTSIPAWALLLLQGIPVPPFDKLSSTLFLCIPAKAETSSKKFRNFLKE
jgi:hypothetical protein